MVKNTFKTDEWKKKVEIIAERQKIPGSYIVKSHQQAKLIIKVGLFFLQNDFEVAVSVTVLDRLH